ncbi:MAG TPA: hypothetical protein VHN99_06495 [Deinococcales bacterium]|nr:hypothetical protein [Deinococcales bacterium]
MDAFAGWGNFCVITGSAGAAMIGVPFVILTLIATLQRRASFTSMGVFATPTVVDTALP